MSDRSRAINSGTATDISIPSMTFDLSQYTLPPPLDYGVPVVIDNGTGFCKVGFAGDDAPRFSIPTVVGKATEEVKPTKASRYVGFEALEKQDELSLCWPVEHGLISSWDDMEKLWHYSFYQGLQVPPESHPIMMSEPPHNTRKERETTAETLFETFNCPAMYMANQAVLAMYSSGKTSGVVLDCGDGMTNVVPVFEGFSVDHAMLRQNFGGKEITDHLMALLNNHGHNLTSQNKNDIVNIKENLCYVAENIEDETQKVADDPIAAQKTYSLPDGRQLTLTEELFLCPEVLFQPQLLTSVQNKPAGIIDMLNSSITKCEPGYQKNLYNNIVLAGGSSKFQGLAERVSRKMASLAPGGMRVKVIAAPERHLAVWIGGSILASLPNFQTMWIMQKDYNELGASVIHRKCF